MLRFCYVCIPGSNTSSLVAECPSVPCLRITSFASVQICRWLAASGYQQCVFPEMDVFHVGKRRGSFAHWEPIFVGTHRDPYYDERLSWEGKKDKMTQVNTICIHIVNNY